jgi:hypothetical protein
VRTSVKILTGILYLFLTTMLVIGLVFQAYAAQMTVVLIPDTDNANAIFTGVRFMEIKYPPGSPLSNEFNGKNERISFTINATDNRMKDLISVINKDITQQKQSPVQIKNASLDYTGSLSGEPDKLSLSYKVVLKPILTKFVIDKNGTQGTVVDLDWRSVVIGDPLNVDTKYGMIDVNYPIGLIQVTHPDFARKLSSSQAAPVMKTPLMDFAEVGIPMDRWHFLFDPTGSQAGAAGSGYSEVGGARAVSVYSIGESSFREGTFTEKITDTPATIDSTNINIHSSTPPPSAQIQIIGFSRIQKSGNNELAFVSLQAPEGTVTATGGFPLQVLLVLGGMMGAVAIFVLVKARK